MPGQKPPRASLPTDTGPPLCPAWGRPAKPLGELLSEATHSASGVARRQNTLRDTRQLTKPFTEKVLPEHECEEKKRRRMEMRLHTHICRCREIKPKEKVTRRQQCLPLGKEGGWGGG